VLAICTTALRFPDQHLGLGELKLFSEQFGKIQGPATRGRDPTQGYPEIDILSNLKEDGRYIGSPDAGQDWHTDMTYREVPGFVNVLYGIRIPHRDGKPLGGTEFSNMQATLSDRRGKQLHDLSIWRNETQGAM
jgi:taurine dioxygenase